MTALKTALSDPRFLLQLLGALFLGGFLGLAAPQDPPAGPIPVWQRLIMGMSVALFFVVSLRFASPRRFFTWFGIIIALGLIYCWFTYGVVPIGLP